METLFDLSLIHILTVPAILTSQPGTALITAQSATEVSNALTFIVAGQALTLTSLSPSSTPVGSPDLALRVNGTGFVPNTTVTWNGSPLSTSFVSASQLTATVPSSLLTQTATAIVSVTGNPLPASLPFDVTATLTLTSLSPNMTVAGGPAFNLTANGSGFTSGTTLLANGAPLQTSTVSSTQLTAAIGANIIAQSGSISITAGDGSQVSNALPLTVAPPPPVIISVSPANVAAGSGTFTLTVNGTGFLSGAAVSFNGTALATTFGSATLLTTVVPATLIAQSGTAQIVVGNPGGATSNAVALTVTVPPPAITSISPPSVVAGGPTFTLTVSGGGFLAGAVVSFNGATLATTFGSATQLTASVPAGVIAQPGSAQITVTNPIGPASNSVSLTITAAAPTITSISPASVAAGDPAFTLTVGGSGFLAGAVVSFNGAALPTTFVSATQLTATVPASS